MDSRNGRGQGVCARARARFRSIWLGLMPPGGDILLPSRGRRTQLSLLLKWLTQRRPLRAEDRVPTVQKLGMFRTN